MRVHTRIALLLLVAAACRTAQRERVPAAAASESWNSAESADGRWRVRWRSEPDPLGFLETARLLVETERSDGAPADALRVDAGMPQHGHGVPRRMQVEALGDGRFAVDNVYLTMPGRWRIYLDLGRAGVFERVELELEVD